MEGNMLLGKLEELIMERFFFFRQLGINTKRTKMYISFSKSEMLPIGTATMETAYPAYSALLHEENSKIKTRQCL